MNRPQMTAPFADEELRSFEGKGGKTYTFIEDETVMDRLDAGYGYGNWQVQVEAIPYAEHVVKVRLGVRENGEWAWYEDFGYPNGTQGETLKEAVSDGIRRCGRYLGIARDLYRKATYEPGGSLGPKGPKARPAPPRLPARTDPATQDPPPSTEPYSEQEEIIGRVRRKGTIRKGSAEGYKLDARQGPEGHVIGFRLEVGPEKHIPQCLVAGPLGESLWLATAEHPEKLIGTSATVAGILYHVKSNRDGSWYRLHVDRFENADWILPADEALPAPPDDVPLVGEAESKPLGLVS